MITLAITLKTAAGIRCAKRFDITDTMPSGADGVFRWWRLCVLQRRAGEHVQVSLVVDGTPHATWTADQRWPRESVAAISQARQQGAVAGATRPIVEVL